MSAALRSTCLSLATKASPKARYLSTTAAAWKQAGGFKKAKTTREAKGFNGGSLPVAPVSRKGKLAPMKLEDHPLFSNRPDQAPIPTLTPELLTEHAVGNAMLFPNTVQTGPIQNFGLPKSIEKDFSILSRPTSVVRGATVTVLDTLDSAAKQNSTDSRFVLSGPPGCGKSYLLLQSVSYCSSSNWIVLYVPRAIDLMNSTSPFVYDARTRVYSQPHIAIHFLRGLSSANSTQLKDAQLKLSQTFTSEKGEISAGASLASLVELGIREPTIATSVLTRVMEELGAQTKYPVLLAVDDFQALYRSSLYRDPQYVPIKSYHLSMPRLLLEYASGHKTFARGAVLGALSTADNTFRLPLELSEALGLPALTSSSPYVKRSQHLVGYANGLKKIEVPSRLSIDEAAGIFDIWVAEKAMHTAPSDELFLAKLTESSGNAREFVWSGLMGTLDS